MQMEFKEDGSLKLSKTTLKPKKEEFPHISVLSLIRELSFPVGKKLLAQVLKGEISPKIKKLNLHVKTKFGSLDLYSFKDIYDLLDLMISKNLIEITRSGISNNYPVVSITKKGLEELKSPSDLKKVYHMKDEKISQITDQDKEIFKAFGSFLEKYNDEQKKAIIDPSNRILCIAGAGTGKTTVLTKRIEFLANLKGVDTNKILAITFTRKAKQEMIFRLSRLIPGHSVMVETFNSFCEKILRKNEELAYGKCCKVVSFKEKINLINKALKKTGHNLEGALEIYFYPKKVTEEEKTNMFFTFIRDVFSIMDHFHNNKRPIADFMEMIKNKPASDDKQTAYFIYNLIKYIQEMKKENGLRDYTDQIVHATRLFEDNPDVIPKFEHILVDEYQDVNKIQVNLLDILKPDNLFVVGDPRQSIYGWRGSKIKYILGFTDKHPESKVIQLTRNYRSAKNIVDVSNDIITPMNLLPLEPVLDDEKPVVMIKHGNEKSESLFIAQSILSQDIKRKNIFVLARTNKQLDNISFVFDQQGIKYLKRTVEDEKQDTMPSEDEITLSTVHAIKGLEAELVYMIGVNSNMYPCLNSDHPVIEIAKSDEYYDKYDEELRLLYVGLTRAKKQLVISYNNNLSRFITPDIKNRMTTVQNNSLDNSPKDMITKLREWRTEIAQRENIPPYMVFPDKTLLELAEFLPMSLSELKEIYGMGPGKISKYGEEILDVLS